MSTQAGPTISISEAIVNSLKQTRRLKSTAVQEYIQAKNIARGTLADLEDLKSELVLGGKIPGQNETLRRAQLTEACKSKQREVDIAFTEERWASVELERRRDDLFTIGVLMQGLSSEKIQSKDALPLIQSIIDEAGVKME
mgnify:CR=1 FL=1